MPFQFFLDKLKYEIRNEVLTFVSILKLRHKTSNQMNPCMKNIIQKNQFFEKQKLYFFRILYKFERRTSFKFTCEKFNFGKLVKINFIFRFNLRSFFFSLIIPRARQCDIVLSDYIFLSQHTSFTFSASNIVTYVFFQIFSNMRVFHKQRCRGSRFGPEIQRIL